MDDRWRTPEGTRYSALKEITAANVANLKEEFLVQDRR